MQPFDYVLIAIVLVSAVVGLVRGLLREVIAVVTWVVALWAAWRYTERLEPYLGGLLSDPQIRPWAARILIALIVLLLGAAIGALMSHLVRLSIFSGMDRFFGMLFGLLRGAILVGVVVMAGQLLQLDEETWWPRSRLIPFGEGMADVLRGLVGEERAAGRASEVD